MKKSNSVTLFTMSQVEMGSLVSSQYSTQDSSDYSFTPIAETSESSRPPSVNPREKLLAQLEDIALEVQSQFEVEETPIEDIRKIDVCKQMIEDMLDAVRGGFMTSDPKRAKKWCKQLVLLVTNAVRSDSELETAEELQRKIMAAWVVGKNGYLERAAHFERQLRYHQFVAGALHQNGWEEEAQMEDKGIGHVEEEYVRARSYAETWEKMIAVVAKGG
jgi:hypothetical protein